ncbi:GM15378 [Drosophila sechellia]|uniref:GM15378 n=1 Tax=Drosophila sechellia TaxID=7238 RepID=B4IBK2_DROSE|nr:GM15378 [Drosophila sechellia]
MDQTDVAFYCPGEGLFADDYDCRIYYRCERRSGQYIQPYLLACPEDAVFSPHPAHVSATSDGWAG